MRIRNKLAIAAATTALLGPAVVMTAGPAFADIGSNWCIGNSDDCINAWGGGPLVNVYTGGPVTNGLFAPVTDSHGQFGYLLFGHFGVTYSSKCIGDNNNDPNNARAALIACPGANGGSTSGDGWGTHLTEDHTNCATGYVGYYDTHWRGWLGPVAGYGNGSAFYLNKQSPYCYKAR